MIPSIHKRFLKRASVPMLALAALAAGCDHGVESTGTTAAPVAASTPAAATPATVAAAPQSQVHEIAIDNFSFNPPAVTVPAGTAITWVNHDDVPHTVTANDKGFSSKALDTDDRFTRIFTTPGTYSYFCMVHPHMTGRIIVK